MTAFGGVAWFGDSQGDAGLERALSRALLARRPGRILSRRTTGAVFLERVEAGSAPLVTAGTGSGADLFAADARLDNRAELAEDLGLSSADRARCPDGRLLELALARRGEPALARVLGAFACVRWEAEARRLTLARDCLGARSLFFHRGDGVVVFCTLLAPLLGLPGVPRELDELAIANFLVANLREGGRTFHRGVERVASREVVVLDPAATTRRYYWSPKLGGPAPYRREADYVERARELFDQAVAATLAGERDVAISLSGGLDSSAVAATAVRLGGEVRLTGYTLVPPREGIYAPEAEYPDELGKVQALAARYPALDARFLAPDQPHALDEDPTPFFARFGAPAYGGAAVGWFGFLDDAVRAAGHPVLLTGLRGNLGLTWPGTHALFDLIRRGRWLEVPRELTAIARQQGLSAARTFVSHVVVSNAPPSWRRQVHRLRGRAPWSVARYSSLNPAAVAELGLARRWAADGFDPWFRSSGWRVAERRAFGLFDRNQPTRDLIAANREAHGFEIRDPHADRRLLEFALQVPEHLFWRGGVTRAFGRAVFADRLPPEILGEMRRGAQGGDWHRTQGARRASLGREIESLEASATARRLLDLPRMRRLLEDWPPDARAAQARRADYRQVLARGLHIGRFIRWVEGGNA